MNEFKSKFLPISLLIILTLSITNAQGQRRNRMLIRNQGFYYTFEGYYGLKEKLTSNSVIDTKVFSPSSYGVKASANFFLNYHLSVGAGMGVLNIDEPNFSTGTGTGGVKAPTMFTIPVLANTQAYLSEGSNSLLAYAEGGYGFRLNHENYNSKGLIYEVGIGYRYRIRWASYLVAKVGYRSFQNNQWWWKRVGSTTDFQWIDLRAQTINLTVAFYYSTRY